jgi:flagellar hook protein FlgE
MVQMRRGVGVLLMGLVACNDPHVVERASETIDPASAAEEPGVDPVVEGAPEADADAVLVIPQDSTPDVPEASAARPVEEPIAQPIVPEPVPTMLPPSPADLYPFGDACAFDASAAAAPQFAFDLALDGPGYFVLEGLAGGERTHFLRPAARVSLDASHCLAMDAGPVLVGRVANARGELVAGYDRLCTSMEPLPAAPTTSVRVAANLGFSEPVRGDWDAFTPSRTSNFSVAVEIYDYAGASHVIGVFFVRTGLTVWQWYALADGSDVDGGSVEVPVVGAHGVLTFATDGALLDEQMELASWDFKGALAGQSVRFDFGTFAGELPEVAADGRDGCVTSGPTSALLGLDQDGYASAPVVAVKSTADGRLHADYGNGQRRLLGEVAVATVADPAGLTEVCLDLRGTTPRSGEPQLAAAGADGRGLVVVAGF